MEVMLQSNLAHYGAQSMAARAGGVTERIRLESREVYSTEDPVTLSHRESQREEMINKLPGSRLANETIRRMADAVLKTLLERQMTFTDAAQGI